ncbi:MAG: glycosyltransferase [Bacteroidetes bacterium]|nr:glycosyltransferase [Bacteroidota bacterium]
MPSQTIIHVINSLGVGGAEVLLVNTIRLLPEYNHVLVTLGPEAELLADIEPQLEAFYCLNALAVSAWPKGIIKLRGIIRKHQPLLVHAHLQVAGILARLSCPKRIPLFYTLHSPYSVDAFSVNKYSLRLERLVAGPWHHLIGVSELALADYQRHVPRSGSGDVVFNMVAAPFFAAARNISYEPGQQLRCVSVGNLKRAKNYAYSLQAFAKLKSLPVSLDIYGAGADETNLKELIEREKLQQVCLKGKSTQVAAILPQYQLYIISSSYEGFGLAPLEAMALGLPTIVSDIPVFREVMGDAALYFSLDDDQQLADILSGIVSGRIVLDTMATKGRERALQIAHPDTYIRSLKAVYDKYIS